MWGHSEFAAGLRRSTIRLLTGIRAYLSLIQHHFVGSATAHISHRGFSLREYGARYRPARATARRTVDGAHGYPASQPQRRPQSLRRHMRDLAKRAALATMRPSAGLLARCHVTLRPCFSATLDAHCSAMPAMSLRRELLHRRASPLPSLIGARSARIVQRASSALVSLLPVAGHLPR